VATQVRKRICARICARDAAGRAETGETEKTQDDFVPLVYRGQRGAQRPAETPETHVVWLITQRSRVQIPPPLLVSAPIGALPVNRACWTDLVTCSSAAGLGGGDCGCGFSSSLPVCAVAPGRPQGRSSSPAPAGAALRANDLEAGKRRPMMRSEEQPPAGWRVKGGRWAGVPAILRGRRSGLTCTHPAAASVAGRHDHDCGDRAAQSGHRARQRPAHAKTRAHPGLGDLPASGAHRRCWRR
jgi:hypothetical protein